MKSPAEGASTACYLAANPAVEKVSGRYFIDCNPVVIGGNSENPELAEKLWQVSADLVREYLV